MNILEQLTNDIAVSMKSKEEGHELRTSTLRMIKAAVKNAEIAKRGKGDLNDDDIVSILSTMVKQRKESVDQYVAANRQDLADKEGREISIIQEYLPQQLSAAELEAVIRATLQETGVTSMKEMGKLMKDLLPKVKGKADGKVVNQKIKEILEGS
ncbi:MAG: aspartyl-tRNA amidotransferase [Thermodesulfovibrio sp.]|nr:aspartyl-tRNA amidotransferase [Thermodesulfovibrio sp.]